MNPEHVHFNNRMNGINSQPLINFSPDGRKMEEIFRELEKNGKKIDAPTVTPTVMDLLKQRSSKL